jgi:hypothetical protein
MFRCVDANLHTHQVVNKNHSQIQAEDYENQLNRTFVFAYNTFHVWCMLRGGDFVKNILYRFIAAQTHFGMPRGAQMSLALNEPK